MIPNLIKGCGISGAIRYNMGEGNEKGSNIRKELAPGAISRSVILGGQGFGFDIDSAERVELARRVMEFNGQPENQRGRTKKCKLDNLHLSLSWEPGQNPSNAEMVEAARGALKALGMEGAQAVFFRHTDAPAPHLHIVASRIDPRTGMAFADFRDQITVQAWALQWEREHNQIAPARRELHRMVDAVRAGDRVLLADILTRRNPTFTKREVDRATSYAGLGKEQAAKFRAELLGDYHVIGLREKASSPVTRYTTRAVLAAERGLQADALALAADTSFGTRLLTQREAAAFHKLTPEQTTALRHACGDEGFAMIAGQAGTGKSRAMAAIRDSYEAEGHKVVGLAWTNSVVQDMRDKGFSHAATISAELGLNRGGEAGPAPAAQWDKRTVVMVDEAAMLATKDLAAVAARAREAGAKLILVGDDKQLGSIERGGMFAPLRNAHGAAEITEVQRVKGQDQRDAFTLMHKGEFRPALALFEKEGALHWSTSAAKAEAELAKRFTQDAVAAPEKSRFIFAHTNEQVDRMNGLARGLAREAGKLGPDQRLETATGPQMFATGDRIQFTGNGRSRQGKEAGFVNGATGTITGIEAVQAGAAKGKSRVAVELDSGKALSFVVGTGKGEFDALRHGYSGTIYKGQGRTIDQTYVLVSAGWKAESSYVAMTRHREAVAVFIPQDVAADREALGKLMGRDEQKRAASGFMVDPASLQREAPREAATSRAATTPKAPVNEPPPPRHTPEMKIDAKAPQKAKEAAPRGTATTQRTPGVKAPSAAQKAAAARDPGRAADKVADAVGNVAGGAGKGVFKFMKALFGLETIVDDILSGRAGPTPEEKIEHAKEDIVAEKAGAAAEKVESEKDRLAQADEQRRALAARLAVMFPGETLEQIERRQRQEHEQDTDRGRERGR
jgi:hypothetical protein